MPRTPGKVPLTPLDATLGLSVRARRGARLALRHLLPSAPLLGCSVRRLTRMSGVARPAAGLRWRSGPHPWAVSAPGAGGLRVVAPGPLADGGPRSPAAEAPRSGDRQQGLDSARREAGIGARALAPAAMTAARELASAASLVWYARWRETRIVRLVREQVPMAARLLPRPPAPHGRPRTTSDGAPLAVAYRNFSTPEDDRRGGVASVRGQWNPGAAKEESPATWTAVRVGALNGASRADAGDARSAGVTMPRGPGWAVMAAVLRHATLAHGDGFAHAALPQTRVAAGALQADRDGVTGEGTVVEPALVAVTVPTAAVATHAVALVERLLRDRVTMAVEETVRRLGARATPERAEPRRPEPPVAPRRADDRVVTSLIDRIRSLERQEQFRHGYLR